MGIDTKITLEALLEKKAAGEVHSLNVIIKGDVQGSVEALKGSLEKVSDKSSEVEIKFIHCGVGEVNSSDVILAHVSKAIIIAFNVGTSVTANQEMGRSPVDVRRYTIIYDVVDDVKAALEGLLEPDERRQSEARAEVRQIFNLSRHGIVAGCYILKGKVKTKLWVDVIREEETISTGKLVTLKRFKDDVKEVNEGYECGIALDNFKDYKVGDIFEIYTIEKIARTL